MIAGLLVGAWVARYLGPEQYGWLNYAAAVVGSVSALTSLGLDSVVVRELVREPGKRDAWLGAAFFLKLSGSSLGFLICVGIVWTQPMPAKVESALIVVVALGMLFQAPDVFELFFQSQGKSRTSAMVRIGACILANLFKILLIVMHAPLLALASAAALEIALTAMGCFLAGNKMGVSMRRFSFDRNYALILVRESWPLALSGLAIYIQAYADQLVIGSVMGGGELGQYAAAIRLVSIFGFVPMVVQVVAAPEITRAKRDDEMLYRKRLHSLYRAMFGLFLITALPLVLLGPMTVRLVFGSAYAGAGTLLPWMALRLFFTNFGVARNIFITNEGLLRFGLLTAGVGALANVGLNLLVVPIWGARGAIAASLTSFAVTTFALELFEPKCRANLVLIIRAIFLPWRSFTR